MVPFFGTLHKQVQRKEMETAASAIQFILLILKKHNVLILSWVYTNKSKSFSVSNDICKSDEKACEKEFWNTNELQIIVFKINNS